MCGWCFNPRTRTVSGWLSVRNLWQGFTPQTGLTFITHHQVLMGERAETLLRQNIQARMPSPLTDKLLTPSPPSDVVFPSPFSPHSLSLSFSLSDSPGTVKSSELSGGMSDDCVEQSAKHTHAHTHTDTVPHVHETHSSNSFFFPEKLRHLTQLWTGSHSVYHRK